MSTWVDLGDLYVKKAGDEVSGSILMANNNLSVAYDSDTTYNVGTEIKSLRDSVYHCKSYTKTKSDSYSLSVIVSGGIVFLYAKVYNLSTNLDPFGLITLPQINSALTSAYYPPVTVSAPMMDTVVGSSTKKVTTALQVSAGGVVQVASRDGNYTNSYLEGFISWGVKNQ